METFLYADNLVLCSESEKGLRVVIGSFIVVCKRKGVRTNADKRKGMVLGGGEGSLCKVIVGGEPLKHASKFKYLGF